MFLSILATDYSPLSPWALWTGGAAFVGLLVYAAATLQDFVEPTGTRNRTLLSIAVLYAALALVVGKKIVLF